MTTFKAQEYLKSIGEDVLEHAGTITAHTIAPCAFVSNRVEEGAPVTVCKIAGFHHPAVRQVAENVENREAQAIKAGVGDVIFDVDGARANAGAFLKQRSTAIYRDMMEHVIEGNRVERTIRKRDSQAIVLRGMDGEVRAEAVNHVDGRDLRAEQIVGGLSDRSVSSAYVENAVMPMPLPLKRNLPEKRFLVARILRFADGYRLSDHVNHSYRSYTTAGCGP